MGKALIDLTGVKKGKLTVIEQDLTKKYRHTRWLCRCECGTVISVSSDSLRKPSADNLACDKCRYLDFTGKQVGKLYVIGVSAKPHISSDKLYDCKCTKCGTMRTAFSSYLNKGGDLCRTCDVDNKYRTVGAISFCSVRTKNRTVEFSFDTEDLEFVSQHYWFLGGASESSQPFTIVNNIRHTLPQLLFMRNGSYDSSLRVLFRNKNTLDCRKDNLFQATRQQSVQYNSISKNNTSGCKGVDFMPKFNKWRARITVNGKETHLGLFDTFEAAVKARKVAEEQSGYYAYNG